MTITKNSVSAQDSQRDGVGGRRFSKAKSIAERLGICSRTIFRWADGGKITRHKINARVVLFDEVEVIAFIESGRSLEILVSREDPRNLEHLETASLDAASSARAIARIF